MDADGVAQLCGSNLRSQLLSSNEVKKKKGEEVRAYLLCFATLLFK